MRAEPYAGLVPDRNTPGYRYAETAPHLLVTGPTGIGKSRRVLAPGAIQWEGPVVLVSSKDDLLCLVCAFRARSGNGYLPQLLDLRPVANPVYPHGVQQVRTDPTMLIRSRDEALTIAELLIQIASVGMGGSTEDVTDAGIWDTLAAAPLASILWAASPCADEILGEQVRGIAWAMEAAEDTQTEPTGDEDEVPPCWTVAAAAVGGIYGSKTAGILLLDPRQRDSVAINVSKALTPWMRDAVRRPDLPILQPEQLDDNKATLYILAPETGTAAAAAVSVVDSLILRWREKESAGLNDSRLLLVIDELPNTVPLPKLTTYIGEARGLGVNIVAAVQATSQLARKYGAAQLTELRDVFPATLVMYGAPEWELLESAARWAGMADRRVESFDQASGARSLSSNAGQLLVPGDLISRGREAARLLRRGTPGELVAVPDYSVIFDGEQRARLANNVKRAITCGGATAA